MDRKVFHLPENLDLTAAAPLRAHLAALLGEGLDLDASNVRRVGGLSAQVLMAAALAWKARGDELRVIDPSDEFGNSMRVLGVPDLTVWSEEQFTG